MTSLSQRNRLGRYRYTAQCNLERTLRRPVWGHLSQRLGMKKFFFVFVSFLVVRIWFLLAHFKNDAPLSVMLSDSLLQQEHHQHHDGTDYQTLLPLTWEGDGKWIDYTCKKKKSNKRRKINRKENNHRGNVMHWNKTAAITNANKYNTTTNPSTFWSYSYEDKPLIMTRIDIDSNNDSNTNGNCPFDSFLTKQYCQERAKTTVCVYPDVILKIVHSRMAWLTELYMFSVLNDTKYFPRLIYHTGSVQRSDIVKEYNKTGTGYKDKDYNRTMYDNNDGSIRIDKNRNECWTMIIENVRPKGKCQNSFNDTKSSRLYYTKELSSVFDKYFAPNHIWAYDLKCRNMIIHSDQIHVIDFGLYEIIDDVEKLNKKNSALLSYLSKDLERDVSWDC